MCCKYLLITSSNCTRPFFLHLYKLPACLSLILVWRLWHYHSDEHSFSSILIRVFMLIITHDGVSFDISVSLQVLGACICFQFNGQVADNLMMKHQEQSEFKIIGSSHCLLLHDYKKNLVDLLDCC